MNSRTGQFILSLFLLVVLAKTHSFKYRLRYTVPPPPEIPFKTGLDNVEEYRFTQKLDHFNSSETATWRQRYYMTRHLYKPGGPAFFLFSGEGELSDSYLQTASGRVLDDMMTNAKRHNAMVFTMEHRYYGQSVTVANPERTENMRWLSARQALADTAAFIHYAHQQHFYLQVPPKWIVFGGSYSGALSAWMRQQYPDLVTGAISSSGGLEPQLDFPGYIHTVSENLKIERQSCYDATKVAFDKVVELMKTQDGRDYLKKKINFCHAVIPGDRNSIAVTIDGIISPFMFVSQYGGDTHAGQHYTAQTLGHLCDIVEDVEGKRPDHLDRLRYLVQWQQRSEGTPWDCIDNSFTETMDSMRESNVNRGWEWQKCNELGGFLSTPKDDHAFGGKLNLIPFEFRYEVCKQIFNMTVEDTLRGLERARAMRGTAQEFNATNVVLVNGSQDPFHSLGVYKEEWVKPGQKVVMMKRKSHCADMSQHMPDDPPEILRARKVIQEEIDKWLA